MTNAWSCCSCDSAYDDLIPPLDYLFFLHDHAHQSLKSCFDGSREYFEDVDRTWETFEKTLWGHVSNFYKLSKERYFE